jgi:ATP-dependent DNA helicase RecQ
MPPDRPDAAADAAVAEAMDQAQATLRRVWGYETFRPGQRAILKEVLRGRDVLGILPTGGGKSICYQVPALMDEGLTLVISPLIALMQDQVAGLRSRGVEASFINSTLSHREIDQRWTDAEHGRYDLLYVAPERLTSELFQLRAERLDVARIAVDEAHCVSEWGHHFRPDYLEIPEARAALGGAPTIAVTATATPAVRRDVTELLGLRDPAQVVRGFDRPNLVWSVFHTDQKQAQMRDIVNGVAGSGLVYASTRRSVERWARWLDDQGVSAGYYHGGRPTEARTAAQQAWVDGETRVMVATNAFGMGIDKPDVRFVVHADLPSSVENYYQEAGRAGRDGERAYAVLLFQAPDADTQQALIDASHPTAEEVQQVYQAVCNLGQIPIGAEPEHPVIVNREAVMQLTGFSGGKVRTAVDLLDRQDVWRRLPRQLHRGAIRFRQSADEVRRYAQSLTNRALTRFVRTLLRAVHADAFSGWWSLDLRLLERRTGLERERVQRGLAFLSERGLLDWRPPRAALQVDLLHPRSRAVRVEDQHVRRARRRAETRLDYMLRYARSVTCRRRFLLAYFGEAAPEACGRCDICLGRHEGITITPDDEPVLRRILRAVDQGEARSDWFDDPPTAPHRLERLVDWLVQEGYLRTEHPLDETYALTDKARSLLAQWAPRDA